MGGDVTVNSQLGKGSVFTVRAAGRRRIVIEATRPRSHTSLTPSLDADRVSLLSVHLALRLTIIPTSVSNSQQRRPRTPLSSLPQSDHLSDPANSALRTILKSSQG
jgi:hypothetical protein